jgi:hypothetical protein
VESDHSFLIGWYDQHFNRTVGHADALLISSVGDFIESDAQPCKPTANGSANFGVVLADAGGEDDPVDAAEGRDKRRRFPSGAPDEEVDRFGRSSICW